MEVTVVSGSRFHFTPNGQLWAEASSPYHYDFWTRYLDVYDRVRVISRASHSEAPPEGAREVTGPNVTGAPLPDFHSPADLLAQLPTFLLRFKSQLDSSQALHIQAPSVVANLAYLIMNKTRPFSLEVKGDPFDSFAPGSFEHPLRPLYRWGFAGLLRLKCATADATAYVTERALQRRYPPARANFTTHFSNVVLPDEAFVDSPREFEAPPQPARLLLVGMLEQLNKAPDIAISAVAKCHSAGYDLHLTIAGDGKQRALLEEQAVKEDIGEMVTFLGRVPSGAAVREQLDDTDLFILPSRQEGLPRAMLEAMARALPAIGSTVGGFDELLPDCDLVPAGDIDALAKKIMALLDDPVRLRRSSARNLEKAREYHLERLRRRRNEFFRHSRQLAELWRESSTNPRSA